MADDGAHVRVVAPQVCEDLRDLVAASLRARSSHRHPSGCGPTAGPRRAAASSGRRARSVSPTSRTRGSCSRRRTTRDRPRRRRVGGGAPHLVRPRRGRARGHRPHAGDDPQRRRARRGRHGRPRGRRPGDGRARERRQADSPGSGEAPTRGGARGARRDRRAPALRRRRPAPPPSCAGRPGARDARRGARRGRPAHGPGPSGARGGRRRRRGPARAGRRARRARARRRGDRRRQDPGNHPVPQHEINTILVEQAQRGRRVVRLKGGDPFVYGRGGEEVLACRAAGVPVDVVPGVSKRAQRPRARGHPAHAPGHGRRVPRGQRPRRARRRRARGVRDRTATLVVLMGVSQLARITAQALGAGADPALPVAIVENGSTPRQRVTRAPLGEIVERAAQSGVRPRRSSWWGRRRRGTARPGDGRVTGTGGTEVDPPVATSTRGGSISDARVDLASGPDADRPTLGQVMAGCTVLVTADRRKSELAAALQRRGAEVRHAPALSMIPHADDEQLLAGTRDLVERPPDVVVVTTGIGFRSWVEAADAHGLADRLLECWPTRGSSRAGPRRAARSRPQASPPTGSPSPRRRRRSPTCCSARASPGCASPCSTTAPVPTGSTSCSRRPAPRSRASSSTGGDRRPTRKRCARPSRPRPSGRSTRSSSPPRPAPRRG